MLKLRTFGGLWIEEDGRALVGAAARRRPLALLALLASAGDAGTSRDKLVAYLWPESSDERARHVLAQTLYLLRREFRQDDLVLGAGELRLNPQVVTSDLAEFDATLARGDLESAVSAYAGPFLDGFYLPDAADFERWTEGERIRLAGRYRAALQTLADAASARGDHQNAAEWWRRLAAADPLSSHVALGVMRALASAGDRAEALRYARVHEALLREELDAAPNPAVLALVDRLREPSGIVPHPDFHSRSTDAQDLHGAVAAEDQPGGRAGVQARSPEAVRGTLADRYEIQREVARGGMATVYLARDMRHEREVAVKVFKPELAAALGAERFLREIALLARLQHPHILPLFDSGEADGSLFYVMPYVAGESVRRRLDRERQLRLDDALQIAREVAGALAYAHSQGVVHRDIKPENILLSDGHALVADFGIARAISRAGGSRLTETGLAIGTPAYISPEQASGDEHIDGRSDVYSLGCVLYEMLAGQPPFSGATPQVVIAQRFVEPPPRLRTVRETVPEEVDAAIATALARLPADRFASADEFAKALAPGVTLDSARPIRARRARYARWAVAAAAVACALGGIALATRDRAVSNVESAGAVDPTLYMVLPFAHRAGAAPTLLHGDHCGLLLYDAMARWEGVKLVNDLRVDDARTKLGKASLSLSDALAIAAQLGAGQLAWGEVWEFGDSVHVRATLYDVVSRGATDRQHHVRVARDLHDAGAKFDALADSILLGSGHPRGAVTGAVGTRSLAAWRAYVAGHLALNDWNLERAEREFRTAAERDPEYPHANLWLAQVIAWAGDAPPARWRGAAERAVRRGDRLTPRDRTLAHALLALADGKFPQACGSYHELLARDSLDFAGWYGLGECHRRDNIVVRDSSSPSKWRFRGSYYTAVQAYQRALQIIPSVHLAFRGVAFSRLPRLLKTETSEIRLGYPLAPDTGKFGAFPSLLHDTLAYVPHPLQDVLAAQPWTEPATGAAAVDRNRETLREIVTTWVQAFPNSVDAREALAHVLETQGRLTGSEVEGSALTVVRHARRLARLPDDQLRLAVSETRLLIKTNQFSAARASADSLLQTLVDPRPAAAARLAGLAALTGRVHRTADLMRRSAAIDTVFTTQGRKLQTPLPLAEARRMLLAYAALGAPVESLTVLEQRTDGLLQTWADPQERESLRAAVFVTPLVLAFPHRGPSELHSAIAANDYLLRMQQALARGDTASVRRQVAVLGGVRKTIRPGDISLDNAYQEAWLLLALGDTAAATERLDLSLNALPTSGTRLLEFASQAAGFVRAMLLRAELAGRMRDDATARRWAQPVLTLWSGADPELEPALSSIRTLAEPTKR